MGVSHPPVSQRSVANPSKQPYFLLFACRRSSRAGIQSAIQGEWVFTRRIEDCAKPQVPGVRKRLSLIIDDEVVHGQVGDLNASAKDDRPVIVESGVPKQGEVEHVPNTAI